MCRLYGFRATEPTKVECSLVCSENALLAQSRRDEIGRRHGDGWGIAYYENGAPTVVRSAGSADEEAEFREAATWARGVTVVSHVRRATVGAVSTANTHPFRWGHWVLAHNGTLDAFPAIRDRMLVHMKPEHRAALRGSTDTEHLFHFLLSLRERSPNAPLLETLREGLRLAREWSAEADPEAECSANVLWTDGALFAGSRLGRSLWRLEQEGVPDCPECGNRHVRADANAPYRSVSVASERLTDDAWREFPDGCVFEIGDEMKVRVEEL